MDPSLFKLIGRILVERVLRNIVKEPAALDDPHWLLTPWSTFIPDENLWGVFVDRIVSDMRGDAYLETINRDSLEYTLSKAYLKPDLDGSYLIDVLVSYIKPTPSASNFFDKAYAASGPPPTPGYVQQGAPQVDIRAEIVAGMFSPGQKPPVEVPADERMHALHDPGESAAINRQKLEEMREEIKKNSEWFTLIQVFYATDRHYGDFGTFGAEREKGGALRYGACEVTIPKKHELGKLESPSFLRLEFRADPRKHITLRYTWKYSENTFLDEVANSVAKSSLKDAFIFVHGYNVPFEDAARRTAQIAFDLSFIGAPIFYSWPSNGSIADYIKDETNVAWSAPHFQKFLGLIFERIGAARIHVIAHSMGNRLVCEAVKALSYDPANRIKLNHLVLAAPDIDADTFRELALSLENVSGRITLYESSKDKALMASKRLHGNTRAGEPFLIVPGVDAIDASAVDTNFLGHSYFSDSYPLLSDIHSILFRDDPPGARFGLQEMLHADGKYFAFRPGG